MKVSILSPVHNEEQHIGEMIESVLAQDYLDFELLIVDDGSSDATVAIASAYAESDSRVRVLGVGGARGKVESFNLAFTHSTGDAFVLLAGDDRIPCDSLSVRVAAVQRGLTHGPKVAAFFKLRTFSIESRFDGMVIPRASRGNRSGGTIAMSRKLADLAFPIAADLVAEDVWLAKLSDLLADIVVEVPRIVLEYRIHAGNSNPRHQPFGQMTNSLHARMLPYRRILDCDRFQLDAGQRWSLEGLAELEERRHAGRALGLFRVAGVGLVDKLRALSSSTRTLYALRSRSYRLFSGW